MSQQSKAEIHDELHVVLHALFADEELAESYIELLAPMSDLTPEWWPRRRDPPWTVEERRRVLLMRIREQLLDGVPLPPVTRADRECVLQALRIVRDWLEDSGPDEVLVPEGATTDSSTAGETGRF
jgi:hypothetical protein